VPQKSRKGMVDFEAMLREKASTWILRAWILILCSLLLMSGRCTSCEDGMSHLDQPASGGDPGIRSMGDEVYDQISRGATSMCPWQWRNSQSSMDELWGDLKEICSHGADEM
jgi:hypothetical protein